MLEKLTGLEAWLAGDEFTPRVRADLGALVRKARMAPVASPLRKVAGYRPFDEGEDEAKAFIEALAQYLDGFDRVPYWNDKKDIGGVQETFSYPEFQQRDSLTFRCYP